jgi:hypothetical protein
MSVQAITRALALRNVSPTEKLLLLVLANYADESFECWPSQRTLAADTCMTDRGVRKILAALEERRFIKRYEQRRKDGYRASDLIQIDFEADHFDAEHGSGDQSERDEKSSPEEISPERRSEEPECKSHRNADAISAEPGSGLTTLEPSRNRQKEPLSKARAPKSKRVPAEWKLTQPVFNLGISLGMTAEEIGLDVEQFRDHEFRDPHSDWDAAFRKWLRRTAQEKTRRERNRQTRAGSVAPETDPRRANTNARRDAWVELAQERGELSPGPAHDDGPSGHPARDQPRRLSFAYPGDDVGDRRRA